MCYILGFLNEKVLKEINAINIPLLERTNCIHSNMNQQSSSAICTTFYHRLDDFKQTCEGEEEEEKKNENNMFSWPVARVSIRLNCLQN